MKNWPFALWGGDGSDDDEGGDEGGDGDPDPQEESITLTKKELESTIAKAVSRSERRTKKQARETLGFDSQEALKEFVDSARETAAASQTDQEKREADIAERERVLNERESSATTQMIDLSVDRGIILAGVTDDAKVKRIRTLVKSELGSDVGTDELAEEIAEALNSVKADMPSLFESKPRPGSGDGGKEDNKPKTSEEVQKAKEEQYRLEYQNKYGLIQSK